eukprot:COSAG02_NODE_2246_length_9389_cov_9.281270_3_plen_66_part_00
MQINTIISQMATVTLVSKDFQLKKNVLTRTRALWKIHGVRDRDHSQLTVGQSHCFGCRPPVSRNS